jgi:hypothetical protein
MIFLYMTVEAGRWVSFLGIIAAEYPILFVTKMERVGAKHIAHIFSYIIDVNLKKKLIFIW